MNNEWDVPVDELRVLAAVGKRTERLTEAFTNSNSPVSEHVTSAVTGREKTTEFDALAELLDHPDPLIRREAADWVDRHAQDCQVPITPGWETWFLSESSAESLLKHLDDEDPNVRWHLLRAYPILKFGEAVWVLPKLVKNLKHPETDIRVAALRAIQAVGQDLASSVVNAMAELLDDPIPEVREEVYRTLEWLGPEGVSAIKPLLQRILAGEKEPHLRRRAVLALDAQNPKREQLLQAVGQIHLADLIQALREVGESGRVLRHALQEAPPDLKIARDHHDLPWLTVSEIARQLNVTPKDVYRWINSQKLVPHGKCPKGKTGRYSKYQIDPADIKRLKKHRPD